jgi:1,4-dihydroxy-2-naphthoate octaprenyltransferase
MNPWISAARPRTLPLALSSILMGSFLAAYKDQFDVLIFILSCLTTILLQVLSNFANDYGDTQNGADLKGRVGPKRAVQSGEISVEAMKKMIYLFIGLSLVSGITLLYISFKDSSSSNFYGFLILGFLSIAAAYFYTAGKKPYGYSGFGDISVFIFFGLVGVLGSNFLYTKIFDFNLIFPAIYCGMLAVGVLNLNNIRDIDSDLLAGKFTIPARIGKPRAIIYHWIILLTGASSLVIFTFQESLSHFYFLISFALLIWNAIQVKKMQNPDPLLKQLALSSLFSVVFFGIEIVYF